MKKNIVGAIVATVTFVIIYLLLDLIFGDTHSFREYAVQAVIFCFVCSQKFLLSHIFLFQCSRNTEQTTLTGCKIPNIPPFDQILIAIHSKVNRCGNTSIAPNFFCRTINFTLFWLWHVNSHHTAQWYVFYSCKLKHFQFLDIGILLPQSFTVFRITSLPE